MLYIINIASVPIDDGESVVLSSDHAMNAFVCTFIIQAFLRETLETAAFQKKRQAALTLQAMFHVVKDSKRERERNLFIWAVRGIIRLIERIC
jgi:hypothetical protein